MAAVKITVRKNGPYRVEDPEGSIELVDADGNKYDLTGKPAFSLCRCGGSVTKPFCDGTHSRIGFQGAESAVKKAENSAEPGNPVHRLEAPCRPNAAVQPSPTATGRERRISTSEDPCERLERSKRLGMRREITRRDFLNGVALTVGAAILPSDLLAADCTARRPERNLQTTIRPL